MDISSEKSLYEDFPKLFFKVVQFVLITIKKPHNSSITTAITYILKSKVFWENVTYPLFQNLKSNDKTRYCAEPKVHTSYCAELLVHASVLELLASERYGLSHHIVEPIGKWLNGKIVSIDQYGISAEIEDGEERILRDHISRQNIRLKSIQPDSFKINEIVEAKRTATSEWEAASIEKILDGGKYKIQFVKDKFINEEISSSYLRHKGRKIVEQVQFFVDDSIEIRVDSPDTTISNLVHYFLLSANEKDR